ncbi:Endonuclease MutS2 [Frankliniella fusca]|uniref:Endonuclease MutS2 n=1 Tax=Frankliniella fusca TaxID=407009 RepID=A0AAE1L6T9_9NEOP|nr:Endonuclease MutS2 [Frankliniella fusca]KAK3909818.1 Endonuclease MutS2 [Frankliniella fusca]
MNLQVNKPSQPLILSKEQLQQMIQLGSMRIISKSAAPEPSSAASSSTALSSTASSSTALSSTASSSTASSTSKPQFWSDSLTKRLLDIAVPKRSMNRKSKDPKFWSEVAAELDSGMNGIQCRNKYFNLNKSRTQKKATAGSSGSAPANYTACERHMEDLMWALKDPLEIPDEDTAHISSPLNASTHDTPNDEMTQTPQTPVCTPYRKKVRQPHGSGSRQAAVRSTLQSQWISFLKRSDERQKSRLDKEEKKWALIEEQLNIKRDKVNTEKERLKFEKSKYEHKKLREKRKEEQMRRLIEIEEERLKILHDMRIASDSC